MLPQVEALGGIEVIETPHLVRQIDPRHDVLCKRDLARLIREHRPEVVHTHSSKAGILGRAAAHSEQVPAIVHTIHGLPFHPYQSRFKRMLYVASERWAARRCHAIVCVADAMREQALAAGVGSRELFTTIYSGLDIDPFLEGGGNRDEIRKRFGFSPEDHVIGTVARLAELKGHDDLLDALAEPMRVDDHLKMLWIGDGYWRDRLVKRIKSLGLEKQVVLGGRFPPEEIPGVMHAIDLLAHPSWREGLPRTVPQALLSGTPVVAHDVDGTPEVVIDGETGWLVHPGDHDALQRAIIGALSNPTEARRMAEVGRDRCLKMFPAERMIDQLEMLYAKLA
jgi:glycosyltransferase involved in cell wall biosynthesis